MGGAGSKTEVKVLTPRQVGVVASPPLTTPRSGRRRGVGTRAEHKVARLERMMRKPEVRLAMSVTTVVGLQRLKRKAQANIAEKRRRVRDLLREYQQSTRGQGCPPGHEEPAALTVASLQLPAMQRLTMSHIDVSRYGGACGPIRNAAQ